MTIKCLIPLPSFCVCQLETKWKPCIQSLCIDFFDGEYRDDFILLKWQQQKHFIINKTAIFNRPKIVYPCPKYMHLFFYCRFEMIHFLIPLCVCFSFSHSYIHAFLMILFKYKENKESEGLEKSNLLFHLNYILWTFCSFLSLIAHEWPS